MSVPRQESEWWCIYVLVISMSVPRQESEWWCIYVLVISMSVPRQESEWWCIYVLVVSILPFSTICLLDCRIEPTVWYFLFSILFQKHFMEY